MTRTEAAIVLQKAQLVALGMGMEVMAGKFEDAELRLFLREDVPLSEIRAYGDKVLPKGRRGRARLVLHRPEEARAMVFLKAVCLRQIGIQKDEGMTEHDWSKPFGPDDEPRKFIRCSHCECVILRPVGVCGSSYRPTSIDESIYMYDVDPDCDLQIVKSIMDL